MTNHHV
jgi:hypothetical protein